MNRGFESTKCINVIPDDDELECPKALSFDDDDDDDWDDDDDDD